MNNDIIWGLRNAVERGYSLDQAVKSYVSAGYSEAEVQEAAKAIMSGSVNLMINPTAKPASPALPLQLPSLSPQAQQQSKIITEQKDLAPIIPPSMLQSPQVHQLAAPVNVPEEKKKRKNLIIILIILVVFLAIILAGIFMFSDVLLKFLAGN